MDKRENYWIMALLFVTLGIASGRLVLWIVLAVVTAAGYEVRRYVKKRPE